jgi:2-polyprenyl-6-hydroxyphenyl methylase/3-demethylubiquinone-9 3-methyltransferase
LSPEERDALRVFEALPAQERWFVRGRVFTAPLAEIAARTPPGRILDLGCGHGALTALLIVGRDDREVTGVDPDPRKIDSAKASVGRLPGVHLRVGTADALVPEHDAAFDAVVIADVLYVVPSERWEAFLTTAFRLLKPGGLLLLHEAEADRSWRHLKWMLQEILMVRIFRRTRSSGGLQVKPRSFTEAVLRRVGFDRIRSTTMSAGYTTPHLLIEAHRPTV